MFESLPCLEGIKTHIGERPTRRNVIFLGGSLPRCHTCPMIKALVVTGAILCWQ